MVGAVGDTTKAYFLKVHCHFYETGLPDLPDQWYKEVQQVLWPRDEPKDPANRTTNT